MPSKNFMFAIAVCCMSVVYAPLSSAQDGSSETIIGLGQTTNSDTMVDPNQPRRGNDGVKGSANCEGNDCPQRPNVAAFGGSAAGVSVTSPFGMLHETMNSNKTSEMISDTGFPFSPLAKTAMTWYNSDTGIATGLTKAFDFSMQMGQMRYSADQAIQQVLNASGAEGRRVWEAYTGCVSRKTSQGVTLSAAQEVCLGNWDRPSQLANETVEPEADLISFAQHPSHPAYEGPMPAAYVTNPNNTTIRNRDYVLALFPPNDANDRDKIKLTHLIFTQPFLRVSLPPIAGESNEVTENRPLVLEYIKNLYTNWLDIFGDIELQEQTRTQSYNAFYGATVKTVAPTFTYEKGKTETSLGAEAPDPFATIRATPFIQWSRYRQDLVYYNLMKIMSNYCHYKKALVDGAGANATAELFWVPTETGGTGGKNITFKQIRTVSPSFEAISQQYGEILYGYLSGSTGFEVRVDDTMPNVCERIDPDLAASKTSLKSLQSYNVKDGSNDYFASTARVFHQLAGVIAFSQINESFRSIHQLVMELTSGNYENYARAAALDMIQQTIGGQWDYLDSLRQAQSGYQDLMQYAREEAKLYGSTGKGTTSK